MPLRCTLVTLDATSNVTVAWLGLDQIAISQAAKCVSDSLNLKSIVGMKHGAIDYNHQSDYISDS